MKSVIILTCLFVVAVGAFSNKTGLSHPSEGRQNRAVDGWGSNCEVALSGTKAFLAVVGVVAAGAAVVATGGAAAPIIGAVAGGAGAIAGTFSCPAKDDLSIIQDHLREVSKEIKAVHDEVLENGKQLSIIKENTMFSGLAGVYGRDILALKNTAKKFERLDRTNFLIEKNQAQKRWMEDTLGHAPGTAFAAVENLMAMIKSGTGIFDGSSRSIYADAQKNQHVFCKPRVRDYLSGLIVQGAYLYFTALEMSGESIRSSDKRIYQDHLKDNYKLFKTHCESGFWCGTHYAKSCGLCGVEQNRCTGGFRPDGGPGKGEDYWGDKTSTDCNWDYPDWTDCYEQQCTNYFEGGLISCSDSGRGYFYSKPQS